MSDIKSAIQRLARERDALVLAHNYQPDAVQEIADVVGDSLALAVHAASTDKKVIVLCGVYFMAETAAILSPQKTVLLPRREAGCPLADTATPERIREMRARYPQAPVVLYINSSAAAKAESDICCTSANALRVVQSLPEQEVILAPDRNLGAYIAARTDKTCHLWDGCCPIHDSVAAETVQKTLEQHPDAVSLAHPECRTDVLRQVQHIFSTSGMLDFVAKSSARKFVVVTERGILCQLRRANPEKEFIFPESPLLCRNMKLTSPEDVLRALETMEPVVTVPEKVRQQAQGALERMLAVPRD